MIPVLAAPSGPPDTRPPNKPGTPPPPKDLAAQLLAAIDEGLIAILGLSVSLPPATDRVAICGEEILKHRLRMARKAVADLRTYSSGRDEKAASGGSRPEQPRAGEPPLPGAAFRLPPTQTVPSFDNGPEFSTGVALL